jgi:tRNA pseudouridine55 synthase
MKNGVLLIDKPEGMASFAVISEVRKKLGIKKAGHAGTLDRFASGVLVVAAGEATKALSSFLISTKVYETEIVFGVTSKTLDPTSDLEIGEPIVEPKKAELETAIKDFIGEIEQVPPVYSALKRGGKRVSDRARKGENIELKPRPATVLSADILNSGIYEDGRFKDHFYVTVRLNVGSGFYVRSFARDFAKKFNTTGICARLRRLSVGPFLVGDSISPEVINEFAVREISPEMFSFESVHISKPHAERFMAGNAVYIPHENAERVAVFCLKNWLGFGKMQEGMLQPARVVKG